MRVTRDQKWNNKIKIYFILIIKSDHTPDDIGGDTSRYLTQKTRSSVDNSELDTLAETILSTFLVLNCDR